VDRFVALVRALHYSSVRFVTIGLSGANYYAEPASPLWVTQDRDLFLPADPDNLVQCWAACESAGFQLAAQREPLDNPRDRWLAERVIERGVLTRASDDTGLDVDLTLVMAGFDSETVWNARHSFGVDGVDIPVARLLHIILSKHAAGRDKDILFLAAHRDTLAALLRREAES
jgi:hypothetical protein